MLTIVWWCIYNCVHIIVQFTIFSTFLYDNKMVRHFDNCNSDDPRVSRGMPQGSILSPATSVFALTTWQVNNNWVDDGTDKSIKSPRVKRISQQTAWEAEMARRFMLLNFKPPA